MTNIDEFIKKHNDKYINYFEAVITSDCEIKYAIPSHIYFLMTLYGLNMNDIYNHRSKYEDLKSRIPSEASPVHWMSEDLGAIVCWYDSIIVPLSYSTNQLNIVVKLMKNGVMSNDLKIKVSDEKSRVAILSENGHLGLLQNLSNRKFVIQTTISSDLKNSLLI